MHILVDSSFTASNAVDIFDASSGRWSTAVLSVARWALASTSLPNQGLAIFAGGGGLCIIGLDIKGSTASTVTVLPGAMFVTETMRDVVAICAESPPSPSVRK